METPPMLVHSILQASLYRNVVNAGSKSYKVHVNFAVENDKLVVQVRDNGPERNEEPGVKKDSGLDKGNLDLLTQRLKVINSSASKPVMLNYSRTQTENIAELTINQPLFNL